MPKSCYMNKLRYSRLNNTIVLSIPSVRYPVTTNATNQIVPSIIGRSCLQIYRWPCRLTGWCSANTTERYNQEDERERGKGVKTGWCNELQTTATKNLFVTLKLFLKIITCTALRYLHKWGIGHSQHLTKYTCDFNNPLSLFIFYHHIRFHPKVTA